LTKRHRKTSYPVCKSQNLREERKTNQLRSCEGDIPSKQFNSIIEKAYKKQTTYYFVLASMSYGMLLLQIAIGATLTALGSNASRAARVAIVILGATNTFIAGLLTLLKSRNQPNRALQFRNGLRGVYEELWQTDSNLVSDDDPETADDAANRLWMRYLHVRAEAEANYPDFWFSLGKAPSGKTGDESLDGGKGGEKDPNKRLSDSSTLRQSTSAGNSAAAAPPAH